MADRYWVGGSGNWSDTGHWSTTSGGAGGASKPTSVDNVFITSGSGFGAGGTITLDESPECNNFLANSGHTYGITGFENIYFYGNFTLEATINVLEFDLRPSGLDSGGPYTIDTKGLTIDGGYGQWNTDDIGTYSLLSNLILTGFFEVDAGIFDANDFNITSGDNFYFYASAGGYTPTIYMGSGTWECNATGSVWQVDENDGEVVTIIPETSTIKFTDSSSGFKQFQIWGEATGKTYNNIWIAGGGDGEVIIHGSNTFNDFKVSSPPRTIDFDPGETTTFQTWTVVGTAGNLITLKTELLDTGNIGASASGGGGGVLSDDATWDGAHDALTGDSGAPDIFPYCESSHFGSTKRIIRVGLTFDTSGIPNDAEIVSATLHMYMISHVADNPAPGHAFINVVVPNTQASPTTIAAADFDQIGAINSPTEASDRMIIGDLPGGETTWDFELNAAGLAQINKTGYTQLGLRSGNDIDDVDLTSGDNTANGVRFALESSYLLVVYRSATQFILSKSQGKVVSDYLDISSSNAQGGAKFFAGDHSVDTTNNDGWLFRSPKTRGIIGGGVIHYPQ